ncbi:Site-specific recombinase XerD [Saccharopolyspora antimicrobica]|uniref:Site-specific recombinase XerD n=1 Tax=Saccharopolyspora antimicrobica TaxID=455193 RepID=A0A1I5IM28_9PSEU|nr:site-specific integrase [Saccharopolyspora antimicrobica]RKT84038.1 site-specific recombinase XerD [Saccharopolyspora antimicrobica]SFO61320.1 Site-specific recombinase XerD [Saccharopolyspora antimicrobica]
MGFVNSTPGGKWRANWRDPEGKQRAKTFRTKREAATFLAQVETQKAQGAYISPHAGRVPFGEHAQRWMDTWNTEATTAARDASIMRNHVLPQWGAWPLAKIDHMAIQAWITDLCEKRSRATVVECYRLTASVLKSAVRNRLIPFNPAEEVRIPKKRTRDTDERIISRADLRSRLLPAAPDFYRGVIATAAGAGLRWGEVAGLCTDALDLDGGTLSVVRTVTEVSGHTTFKSFPKSKAGRRTVPLPPWLIEVIGEHIRRWPPLDEGLVFSNTVGKPLRRTLFRSRVWKPSLVRAGLLGKLTQNPAGGWTGTWTNQHGAAESAEFATHDAAVLEVARKAADGLRFHDLRHSYATWLVDDGVPVNMVQRVMGHERASTTLDHPRPLHPPHRRRGAHLARSHR